MKTQIIVRTLFQATHAWENCPHEEVSFLKNPHRHVFHVEVALSVTHDDRQLEFFMVKRNLDFFLQKEFRDKYLGSKSCEMLCKDIYCFLNDCYGKGFVQRVRVMEDNENGSEIFC